MIKGYGMELGLRHLVSNCLNEVPQSESYLPAENIMRNSRCRIERDTFRSSAIG